MKVAILKCLRCEWVNKTVNSIATILIYSELDIANFITMTAVKLKMRSDKCFEVLRKNGKFVSTT